MAKFTFKLENVLKLKSKMEDQKKLELGSANQSLEERKKELLQIEKNREKYIKDFYEKNGQRLRAFDLARLNQSIKFFTDQISVQNEKIQSAQQEVEEKKNELKLALFEKKKYEVLKEKAYENYLEEEKEEEKKVLDELVNYKYRNN